MVNKIPFQSTIYQPYFNIKLFWDQRSDLQAYKHLHKENVTGLINTISY